MSARVWWTAATFAVVAASGAGAQSIAQRVDAVRDGTVEMTFDTRPGVCGDGRGSTSYQGRDAHGWQRGCVHGPMRVTLGRANGETVSIRDCVACESRESESRESDAHALGSVPPREAALYLLGVARSNGRGNAGRAVGAAAMADAGDLSSELLKLVRDEAATMAAREQAVFWYGESDAADGDLVALYDSLKPQPLRRQYVFVLSQRHEDRTLDKLIDIARHDGDPDIRKQAMFWLGQTHDPKAVQFFKDILVR